MCKASKSAHTFIVNETTQSSTLMADRSTSELETFHGSLTLLEDVLLLANIYLWGNVAVFFFCPKVVLNQVKGLLIYFLVLMALQEFNLIQACKKNTRTSIKF